MIALCRDHHPEADAGAFSNDGLRELKRTGREKAGAPALVSALKRSRDADPQPESQRLGKHRPARLGLQQRARQEGRRRG